MTQATGATTSPEDNIFIPTVTALREAHPTLSVPRLLQQLKQAHPDWAVSDKRLRKAVQLLPSHEASSSREIGLAAQTGLDATITVPPKLKIKMFGGEKGKGLVAKGDIQMGEVLWQEEPWIVTGDPGLIQYTHTHQMCSQCFSLFSRPSPPLSVSCQCCDTATFCNRLCMARAQSTASHHELLCPGQNPGAMQLLTVIRQIGSRNIEAVSRILALWIGERARGKGKDIEKRVWAMARVDQRVKEMERREWEFMGETRQADWKRAHAALVSALNPSASDSNNKAFRKLLARTFRVTPIPLTELEEQRWFSFDSFLQLIGLVGLNQEDSGGLYALHAHLNHSCEPNVQARNLSKSYLPPVELPCDPPPPLAPGVRGTNKLTMLARRAIHPGEELTISYVNFSMPRDARRQALRENYGFWCSCTRCKKEDSPGEGDRELCK